MTTSAELGRRIREAVDALRHEGHALLSDASAIEDAWRAWDLDYLVGRGVITQRMADEFAADLEEESA